MYILKWGELWLFIRTQLTIAAQLPSGSPLTEDQGGRIILDEIRFRLFWLVRSAQADPTVTVKAMLLDHFSF
jgi:hypothetical protein